MLLLRSAPQIPSASLTLGSQRSGVGFALYRVWADPIGWSDAVPSGLFDPNVGSVRIETGNGCCFFSRPCFSWPLFAAARRRPGSIFCRSDPDRRRLLSGTRRTLSPHIASPQFPMWVPPAYRLLTLSPPALFFPFRGPSGTSPRVCRLLPTCPCPQASAGGYGP